MNLPRSKGHLGFTLIELMIVVVIISIIAVSILPSFATYIRNQNLRQAQEQLRSDLRTAQNKALSGTLSDATVPGGALMQFWGIQFTISSGSYPYFISAVDDACPPANHTDEGISKLPANITVRSVSGCMFFSVKDGGITTIGISSPINVGLTASSTAPTTFNPAGLIF